MKKLLTLTMMLFAFASLSKAQTCGTVLKIVPSGSFAFCVDVDANKLSNGLVPELVEFSYITNSGKDTSYITRGGIITNTVLCYQGTKAYHFYNIQGGSPSTLKCRTLNVVIERFEGTNDTSSPYYNPYYGKTDQQIYDMFKNDPTKWCYSTTVDSTSTTTVKGKKK